MVSFFRRLKLWQWILIIGLVTVIGGGIAWRQFGQKEEVVETITPRYQPLQQTLEFTGLVNAHDRVQLRFATGGEVIYIGAQEGDTVKRGQTIVSLDRRSMEKSLEKSLSLYETQRRTFEGTEDTLGDYIDDDDEKREAEKNQFALERSVLDVEIQSLAIENSRLSSPLNGVLVTSPVTVTGVNIFATDIFEIVDPDTLYFQLLVDEVDVDKMYVGQKAYVRLDARPDDVLEAIVADISLKAAQGASGTVFPVELDFIAPVSIQEQRLGMNGEAAVVLAEKDNVLTVPIETVTFRDGESWVEVLVDSEVQRRVVVTGVEGDDSVEIVSGLSENDQVVLP
ncbi:efflux RND transporter periplasmic adaptor subunit [Candidatus Woesebacteria bacterium]|nr:efflux RND transporter periplasmic adaptor subunit [Candidatus Woesebacteria bacterium]MCD8527434.1 efflux RND transporter periplasmic adaptor subunit [Candidatus Woesebacteria bacterium]MCD8546177.1 efflux RND transporter periplasmic adaptor subunit [Candidatus Woesebacteria bacterium]